MDIVAIIKTVIICTVILIITLSFQKNVFSRKVKNFTFQIGKHTLKLEASFFEETDHDK